MSPSSGSKRSWDKHSAASIRTFRRRKTRDTGILEGSVKGNCTVKYIPLKANVNVGDIVLTSGLGKIFPKGILVGKISNLGKDRLGLYTRVHIDLAAEIDHLEEALCIVNQ